MLQPYLWVWADSHGLAVHWMVRPWAAHAPRQTACYGDLPDKGTGYLTRRRSAGIVLGCARCQALLDDADRQAQAIQQHLF